MINDRTEADRNLYAAGVLEELKQLSRLLEVAPPLNLEELAHRMAWPVKDLRKILKMMRIELHDIPSQPVHTSVPNGRAKKVRASNGVRR